MLKALKEQWDIFKLKFHECNWDKLENKQYQWFNPDPELKKSYMKSPLSIYGPFGSYMVDLYHCLVCDVYWGKYYDMYGGKDIGLRRAKSAWLADDPEYFKGKYSPYTIETFIATLPIWDFKGNIDLSGVKIVDGNVMKGDGEGL